MAAMPTLAQLDIRLFWLINSAHNPLLDVFFGIFTNLGSGWVAVPILAFIAVIKMKRHALMHVALFIAVSTTMSGVTNSLIKGIVKRDRPISYFAHQREIALANGADLPDTTGQHALTPHVVGPRWKHRSFPSGHANTAFSAATVLFLLYGGLWALAYGAAALVAYSRVYAGVHFPLDTVGGALIAIAIVAILFHIYKSYIHKFRSRLQ
jgi:undecaprenyl-diphosphatase